MDFPRLVKWLKLVPGYNAKTPQVLGHDTTGTLTWLPCSSAPDALPVPPVPAKTATPPPAKQKPAKPATS